ncbi:hypothetical protein LTS10_003762 [Elasticomyces elasticus]|nr:hypothetical protein LTS10_003762 [Elasticomyces elasticus]
MDTGATDTLSVHLQALPVELQDEIYTLTFTAAPIVRYIDEIYKPLALLQVDCASRTLFAKSYYGDVLVFECADTSMRSGQSVMSTWFRSLTGEHQALIRRLRKGPTNDVPIPSIMQSGAAWQKGIAQCSFRGFPRIRAWHQNGGVQQVAFWTTYS